MLCLRLASCSGGQQSLRFSTASTGLPLFIKVSKASSSTLLMSASNTRSTRSDCRATRAARRARKARSYARSNVEAAACAAALRLPAPVAAAARREAVAALGDLLRSLPEGVGSLALSDYITDLATHVATGVPPAWPEARGKQAVLECVFGSVDS